MTPKHPTKLDLSYLSPPDRVLVAHAVSGITHAEISARVGMTEGRVQHRLLHAAKLLRELGQDVTELERNLR